MLGAAVLTDLPFLLVIARDCRHAWGTQRQALFGRPNHAKKAKGTKHCFALFRAVSRVRARAPLVCRARTRSLRATREFLTSFGFLSYVVVVAHWASHKQCKCTVCGFRTLY